MVDLSCMQVWWEWAPKDGVKPCLRESAFWRRGNLWDNVGDILSWLFGVETLSAKPIPTAAQQAAPGGTTRAALQVRHCPAQLFCSNCTLTTLLQGIYTGKHSECAGWESLKSTALAYWSRNSYFLPHNYFCFASGLHNSHSKSFGVSQGSLIPKISNHCFFCCPFSLILLRVRALWAVSEWHLVCLTRGPGLQQLLVSRDQSMLWAAAAISWSFNP